ncbi:MAG: DUF177 domain-containing protein [Ilumatobacteraceae bacterium]|nr:DUF177 domain-containing protein [Ilumatobacteraceae bacterium]
MATPLVVNIVELLRRPGTIKDINALIAVADFDFADERIADVAIPVTVHLESLANGVAVSGQARAQWRGMCRRCLRPIDTVLTVEFAEMYQLILEDPNAFAIEQNQVSLLPMVRENILLTVPLAPTCRDDCPGLCGQCGADLSEASCACTAVIPDPRWAVLDSLRENLTKDS